MKSRLTSMRCLIYSNEDPSSSYRQNDLLDDSETNISDTPGIKLPHKFQVSPTCPKHHDYPFTSCLPGFPIR